MRPSLASCLVASFVLLTCFTAHAAAPPAKNEAKAHYVAGTKHYALSEFTEALAEFKEAFRIHPDPVFLFNIAQCYRRLNDPAKASEFYRSYLREAPSAPNRAEVERIISELDAQAEAERQKRVEAERAAQAEAARQADLARANNATKADASLTASPPEKKPLVKKGWFWGAVVGGAAVVAAAVTLGVVFGVKKDPVPANGTVEVQ